MIAKTDAGRHQSRIDEIVSQFIEEFEIPGAALAVVLPDGSSIMEGYGVRLLGDSAQVDTSTQFAIASTTKAFLSSCLALMVDEGKLAWDDLVIRHLPEFRMYDPVTTSLMTVRDLLLHHSGLPMGSGDLMVFPGAEHSPNEILRGLEFLKPTSGFRAEYKYVNILYQIAAIVLERVSGQRWDEFVRRRIFDPLGMTDAVSNPTPVRGQNRAGRHARLGPPARGFGQLEIIRPIESATLGPSGGINASISEMTSWLRVQLNRGVLPDGNRLWSVEQSNEMWTPRTISLSSSGPSEDAPERPVIQGYALGWTVNDFRGRRMVAHGGSLPGQVSRAALLPEVGIGLFVGFNTEDVMALSALRYAVFDYLTDAPAFDWLAATRKMMVEWREEIRGHVGSGAINQRSRCPTGTVEHLAGRYRDSWYGDVVVGHAGAGLTIQFMRTPVLKSKLEPIDDHTFRTRFPREFEDAVVKFDLRHGAAVGIKMNALSPFADFSYNYGDLNFVRVA